MEKKSERRYGIAYYDKGCQRFYIRENLTIEECKEKFRNLVENIRSQDEITNIVAFESIKSFSVYDGWCDYGKEV